MDGIGRKLVVLSSVATGASFLLTETPVGIGREDDNAICLEDGVVAPRHAVLIRENDEYILRDLNSMSGTFLNGRRTREAHLKVGDRIRIGKAEMAYATVAIDPSASVWGWAAEVETLTAEKAAEPKSLRIRTTAVDQHLPAEYPSDFDSPRQVAEHLSAASESEEICRLVAELAQVRDAARRDALLSRDGRQTGEAELLEKNRQLIARMEAVDSALTRVRRSVEGVRLAEMELAVGELAQVRAALETAAELHAPVTRLAKENEDLRKALGRAHDEIVVARRCLGNQTTVEFGRIRQSMIERNAAAAQGALSKQLGAARRALHLY